MYINIYMYMYINIYMYIHTSESDASVLHTCIYIYAHIFLRKYTDRLIYRYTNVCINIIQLIHTCMWYCTNISIGSTRICTHLLYTIYNISYIMFYDI